MVDDLVAKYYKIALFYNDFDAGFKNRLPLFRKKLFKQRKPVVTM